MSDPGARDPADDAYVRAETALEDDAARAARRARVLAAVAGEQVSPAMSRSRRRPIRRYVGALAAAAVAGLSVLTATELQQYGPRAPAQAPPTAAPSTDAPAAPATAPNRPTPSKAPSRSEVELPKPTSAQAPSTGGRRPQTERVAQGPAGAVAPPRPDLPPPPPLPIPPTAAPVRTLSDEAQTSASPWAGEHSDADGQESPAPSAPSTPIPPPAPSDGPARLRAAAAAGRTSEVQSLLLQGIPVDAADPEGDTALMQSVRADHPATAALLRRYGAGLDRFNKTGESARTIAAAKDDPQLSEALKPRP